MRHCIFTVVYFYPTGLCFFLTTCDDSKAELTLQKNFKGHIPACIEHVKSELRYDNVISRLMNFKLNSWLLLKKIFLPN